MSEPIHIGNCPECGHFPSQLVGSDSALHYVIHLPEKSNGQAGPHKRIHDLEAQLKQAEALVAELESAATQKRIDSLNSAFILRKQAEAVEGFLSEIHKSQRQQEEDFEVSISHSLISQHRLEDYAQRLRQQADELQAGDVGRE